MQKIFGALFIALLVLGAASGQAPALLGDPPKKWTKMTLMNGWHTYSGARAPMAIVDETGIVHLRGTANQTSGNNAIAFVLPEAFRPPVDISMPMSVLAGKTGVITIQHDGVVYLMAQTQNDARVSSSLEGISYSK